MILFTGDHQLSFGNLPRFRQTHEHLLSICEKKPISAVVNLGDLKDAFNPVDVRIVNEAVDHIGAFSDMGIPYFLLLGNHDKTGVNEESPNWFPTLRSAGAICIDKPEILKVGRTQLYCLPFSRDKDAQRKQLAAWGRKTRRGGHHLLLFHDAVRGAWLNVHRQVVSQDQSAFHVSDLNAPGYRFCIGGHLHLQHKLKPNVWYVGSPYSCDWGEANQQKGFLLFDEEQAGKLIRIKSRVPGWYDPLLRDFEEPRSWKGATIRIQVPSEENPLVAKKKAQQKYKGATVVTVPLDEEEESVEVTFDPGANEQEIIRNYVEQTHPGELAHGSRSAAAYLLNILSQVKQTKRNQLGIRFLSVEGERVLSFEKVSCSFAHGLHLITGVNKDRLDRSNGSGKTSYLNLSAVALFGRTMKGQKHDRWTLRGSKGKAWVRFKFLLPDGRKGEIYRQRKPAKVQLFIDGKEEAQKNMDLLISKITGLTWETLENAVYVDQRGTNLLLSGTDAQRKEMLASMLNLKRFEEARQLVRVECNHWNGYMLNREDDAISADGRVKETLGELRELQGEEEDLKAMRAGEKILLDLGIQLRKEVTKFEERQVALLEEQHDLNEKMEEFQEERAECKQKMIPLRNSIKQAKKGQGTCPTCEQELPEDKGADILIMAWERDLTRWEKKLKKVFAEEAPTEQAYNETSEDLEQLERTLSNAKTAIRDLEAGALPDIRQKIAQEETKEGFRKTLRAKLKRFRKEKAIHEAAFELGKAEMEFLRFCISVLNKDGLPVFLMGQILPRLSKLARYYSNLFSGGDISLQFGLVDEDVDVQIVNETGGEFIGDQSQGELRLASLICSFALRDLMSPCDVLIADEPGEGLDEPTARQFAKGLRNCSKRFPTILATTHNVHILSELSDQEQTIITKEGGVSSVG